MDNYINEFVDKYFECFRGKDRSLLFLRFHPTEDIVYATLITPDGMMCDDMYIANPDDISVKGTKFEYACIQNKSLELDGEFGEADYDTFIHLDGDNVYMLYTPDIRKSNILTRDISKYQRMVTPQSFENF